MLCAVVTIHCTAQLCLFLFGVEVVKMLCSTVSICLLCFGAVQEEVFLKVIAEEPADGRSLSFTVRSSTRRTAGAATPAIGVAVGV